MSLGNFCRWLAEQAESLEIDIFPGFTASHLIYENDKVVGLCADLTGSLKMNNLRAWYRIIR